MICFTLQGYRHFFRSLLRFTDLTAISAQELVYRMNTANLDSYSLNFPENRRTESRRSTFEKALNYPAAPYKTEVQLYKSIHTFLENIDYYCLTEDQKDAVRSLRAIADSINHRFSRTFGMDIEDRLTSYRMCAKNLIPRADEPYSPLRQTETSFHQNKAVHI